MTAELYVLMNPQLEAHLSKAPWFAGEDELTAADFMMIFVCEALVFGKFVSKDSAIGKYALKIESRCVLQAIGCYLATDVAYCLGLHIRK